MRGFSKAIIAGNLTRDPELRSTANGSSVCGFTVAVNRVYRDSSGSQQESVSFIDCSAWGKTGETIAQYAKKGSGLLISGRLDQRSWEDKNSGQKRSRVEIVVEDFNFIGTGERDGGNNYSSSKNSGKRGGAGTADVAPDDLPNDEQIDLSEIPF